MMNQILVKKKSMAEENENLIKYVDLNGSIISTDDLHNIADKSRDSDDTQPCKNSTFLGLKLDCLLLYRGFQFRQRH